MKTLYVVRHAKSSWENTDLPDLERPLNDRGKTDAPRMGKRLKEKEIYPELLISSPAKRAFSTAKRIAEILNYKAENIKIKEKLYHAGADQILGVLKNVKDSIESVMIFGHNPGLTDFVNEFSEEDFVTDNIPTCGIAAFHIPIESWTDIKFGIAELQFFDYPKTRED
jgi:phosphohistidine phosphatase